MSDKSTGVLSYAGIIYVHILILHNIRVLYRVPAEFTLVTALKSQLHGVVA